MKKVILTFVVMVFMTTLMFAVWDIDENFDSGTNLPTGWSVIDNNGGFTWGISTDANKAHSGSNTAATQLGHNTDDYLITPLISVQTGDTFTFWALANFGNDQTVNVMLATGVSGGNEISDFTTTLGNEIVGGIPYVEYVYNLDGYVGDVYLAIHQNTGFYAGLHIDDVKVGQEGSAAPAIPGNVVVVIDGNDADLSWDASPTATDYRVEYSTDPYSGYIVLAASTGGALTWPHTDGALDTKYFYRVIALD